MRRVSLKACLLSLPLLIIPTPALFADEIELEVLADGLREPWSLAFLPNGDSLLTEKSGQLRRLNADNTLSDPLTGVPNVYYAAQGGLFDVVLHPEFERNQLVYLSFAEGTPKDNGTAIARGRLVDGGLLNVEIIFRNFTRKDTPVHYGGRMVFLPDGSLLLTTGDGFDYREASQDIQSGLGKVLRLADDGKAAQGNPFPDSPYVFSYGHRNPQGLALGKDGSIWLHEHGPRGGDELNRLEAGINYGWPAITYGVDYSGAVISPYTQLEGMAQPEWQWTPSIAPSGLTIYDKDMFAEMRGDLLIGALVDREVRRLEMEGRAVVAEHSLLEDLDSRIRDIRVAPDGSLRVLTSDSVVRAYRKASTEGLAAGLELIQADGRNFLLYSVPDVPVMFGSGPVAGAARTLESTTGQAFRYQQIQQGGAGSESVHWIEAPRSTRNQNHYLHFPQQNVLFMGELFVPDHYPLIDVDKGATVHGMIGAVQSALGQCGAGTRVIPASGPVSDCADLEDFGEVLYKTMNRVRRLQAEGKSLAQVIESSPIKEFDQRTQTDGVSSELFLEGVYRSLAEN